MRCGVGHRPGSDPALLRLWCKPAVVAPICPLAWEPPYATGVALKRQKTNKKPLHFKKYPLLFFNPNFFVFFFLFLEFVSRLMVVPRLGVESEQ